MTLPAHPLRMLKKVIREIYLLPRWEQKAILLFSLLLIAGTGARVVVEVVPPRDPPGMQEFLNEARIMMDSLELEQVAMPGLMDSFEQEAGLRLTDSPGHKAGLRLTGSFEHGPGFRLIELNRADSTDLLPLPGIGPVFASRIIRYRDLLGGFVSHDQLGEVYGLPENTVSMLRERTTIDTLEVVQIELNTVTFRNLLRHPYLAYDQVLLMLRYRDVMGGVDSLQELVINDLITDSTLSKLAPYLRCTPVAGGADQGKE